MFVNYIIIIDNANDDNDDEYRDADDDDDDVDASDASAINCSLITLLFDKNC